MYLETRLEPKRNLLPHIFLLALIVPALSFWAWTEVSGSTRVSFEDAITNSDIQETLALGCNRRDRQNKYYHDCLDQISLFEAATAKAAVAQKPLMIVFGHEGCARCQELEAILHSGSDLADSTPYREVAEQVLQLRLVRYKPEAREIAKELDVVRRAVDERGRLYAPYILFYDPATGNTSHVKWGDHSNLNPNRLGVALKNRLGEI